MLDARLDARLYESDRDSIERSTEYVIAGLLVLVLWALTVVSFARPGSLEVSHQVTFNAAITTASLLVALGASYFVLIEFLLYGRLTSLLVGSAFLIFAIANGGMGLIPLLAGWDHADLVPYGWAAQRVVGSALLVLAPFARDREFSVTSRRRLVAAAVGIAVLISAVTTVWVSQASGGVPPHFVQIMIQLVACVLLFGSAALFWRTRTHAQSGWFLGLALSLAVAGFAELQYAIHPYKGNVAQLGDVLRFVFYTGILLILAGAGSRGYRRLRWQARELAALQSLMTPPSVEEVSAIVRHVAAIVGETLGARVSVLLPGRSDSVKEGDLPENLLHLNGRDGPSHDVQTVLLGNDANGTGRSMVAVALQAGGHDLGSLVVDRQGRADFNEHDLKLLRGFGAQASVLLERSLLYEEVAAGAVLQERSRLAREIHDGLAQHLAFLKMRVSWLKRSPAALDVGQLIDIETVLETALTEARQAITTLRAEMDGTSTAEAIAGYASEFGQVSGLNVQVEQEPMVPEIGPKARVELLRVVQEALNNVRKHANARNVVVRIGSKGAGMEVFVRDDGAGFTLKEDLQGHFGMDIMTERAESIGGELEVVSLPRRGTTVRIWVPAGEGVLTGRHLRVTEPA